MPSKTTYSSSNPFLFIDQSNKVIVYLIVGICPILAFSFFVASWKDPGYLKREHSFIELLKNVHPCEMCPDCEVLRTPRSRHCAICNRCVERFDHHCPWINNCVGINNHNYFLSFLISLTVVLSLIAINCLWTMIEPCGIKNPDNACPFSELCLGGLCKITWLRDTLMIATIVIGLFFGLPVAYLSYLACRNYCLNKTTNERFAKAARTQSTASDLESVSSFHSRASAVGDDAAALLPGGHGAGRGRRRRGCWANCGEMCCNKRVMTQQALLDMHMAESMSSSAVTEPN